MDPFTKPEHVQGSDEWLAHRRKHIGASDAPIIMGESPWKTQYQLWEEKLGLGSPAVMTPNMQRGIDLEPLARQAFERETGLEVFPGIEYHPDYEFMMASMDGVSLDKKSAVEIKCPGQVAHSMALGGEVPLYYKAQLQHQMSCLGLDRMWYYSYDGTDGVSIRVDRDQAYIDKMIEKEKGFWECVQTFTAPPLSNKDYQVRNSPSWAVYSSRLSEIDFTVKSLTAEKDEIRKALIEDCDGQSTKGEGLILTRTFPKGRVNYGAVPELDGVDLEPYRKESKETWTLRIS